jgi:hypothetical protein
MGYRGGEPHAACVRAKQRKGTREIVTVKGIDCLDGACHRVIPRSRSGCERSGFRRCEERPFMEELLAERFVPLSGLPKVLS